MKEQPKSRELLPCPFCGEPAEWIKESVVDSHFHLRCSNGECHVTVSADRRDKAIGFWNRRVGEEPPKPDQDLKQTIIDGQRIRLSQLHEACEWCVDKLSPFSNMEAIGPLESFRLKEIEKMLNGEKLSGEAKTPDQAPWIELNLLRQELVEAMPTGSNIQAMEILDVLGAWLKKFDRFIDMNAGLKSGGSVPTPSDGGEPFLEPMPLLKGDPRVTINGNLVREDFRIIAEEQYQRLRKASGNKFRFRLFT